MREFLVCGIEIEVAKSDIAFADESDRIFYDTANESGSTLITGNFKHYPASRFIMVPTAFLNKLGGR